MSTQSLFPALAMAARRFRKNPEGQWQDQAGAGGDYREILRTTLLLGHRLAQRTDRDELIGVLLGNDMPGLGAILGLIAYRRVPCLLNSAGEDESLRAECQVAGVKRILTTRAYLAHAGLAEGTPPLNGLQCIFLEDLETPPGRGERLRQFLAGLSPRAAGIKAKPETPAVVLFTPGSEGQPKGVALSHRALLASVELVLGVLPLGPQEIVFNCMPLHHPYGLTLGALLPLFSGARLVLHNEPHDRNIPRRIRETGATVLFSTNTFLKHYARHAGPDDFRSLKYVVAGAEKLTEEVRRTWRERFNIDILEAYGATETAPILAINQPGANRPGTVGKLLPGINAMILPAPGIPHGGTLHVRGNNLMSGYYQAQAPGQLQLPDSQVEPGWFDTGDVVEIDRQGFLVVRGRIKRYLKLGAEMVSLAHVEAIARAASPDADHAAIGAASGRIVLFSTDPELTRDRLLAACRAMRQPESEAAHLVQVVQELPRLGSGKVDYLRLEKLVAEP